MLGSFAWLSACGQNQTSQTPNANQANDQSPGNPTLRIPANKLIVAINAEQATLDPGVTMDNSAWKITYPAYERLVAYDGATTEIKPSLAKTWSVSEDGKTWTFQLEEGHRFSDGTPVDAEAVKFSFERTLKLGKGPAELFGVIQQIQVVDPYTVQFTLKKNFPPFLSTLATNYASIVNPKVMEHEKDGDLAQGYLSGHTAGSGPYMLSEWRKGEYYKLEKNPHHPNRDQIAFDTVLFKIVPDAAAQRLQLEKGEIDIAEGIPIEQIDNLDASQVTVVREPSLLVDYVYINTSRGNPALKDVRVRQALSYAVDYPSIIDVVQQGNATQMRGPIPKGLWGHDPSAMQYTYDPEKARQLLQEAGVHGLKLTLLYSDNKPWWETEAITLQALFQAVGVEVELKKVAYATMREMLDRGEFDLSLGVWSPDFGDPYMFMNYWFDSNNFGLAGNRAFYKNDRVNELIRKAATINDQAERERLYREAQKIVIEEAPYIYLYQKDFVLPMRKEIQGFVYNPMLEGIYNLESMKKPN
ncbi:peptide ABC transporter substrate-binding protein [Hydrogenibacillus schlegelii]|nr:peptide ABC transporter substrate-binding protein [Hydrogenibacillus schlegelii]